MSTEHSLCSSCSYSATKTTCMTELQRLQICMSQFSEVFSSSTKQELFNFLKVLNLLVAWKNTARNRLRKAQDLPEFPISFLHVGDETSFSTSFSLHSDTTTEWHKALNTVMRCYLCPEGTCTAEPKTVRLYQEKLTECLE